MPKIPLSQASLFNSWIAHELAYIQTNFGILISSIGKLESQGLTINEASLVLGRVREALLEATGEIAELIQEKFSDIITKNPDLETISKIGRILDGEKEVNLDMPPNMISFYKYAPLTSVDVERSFSTYKNILADNRCSYTPENFEMYIICNCEKRK
jgi:hypothetical protein